MSMAQLTSVTLSTRSTPAPLRAFTAPAERSVKSSPTVVGDLTGWFAQRVHDVPPPTPRDMPQEQKNVALLAVEMTDFLMPEKSLGHLDNLILLDSRSLTPQVTQRNALASLVTELVGLLQLDYHGCLVATDLEHLEDETTRSVLREVLATAGFTAQYSDEMLWTLVVELQENGTSATRMRPEPDEDPEGVRRAHIEISMEVQYTRGDLFDAAGARVSDLGFIDQSEELDFFREVTTDEQHALQSLFDLVALDDAAAGVEVTETCVSATDIRALDAGSDG